MFFFCQVLQRLNSNLRDGLRFDSFLMHFCKILTDFGFHMEPLLGVHLHRFSKICEHLKIILTNYLSTFGFPARRKRNILFFSKDAVTWKFVFWMSIHPRTDRLTLGGWARQRLLWSRTWLGIPAGFEGVLTCKRHANATERTFRNARQLDLNITVRAAAAATYARHICTHA